MSTQQHNTRSVQYGRVSGTNNISTSAEPHIHNNNSPKISNTADYFSGDDADADADIDVNNTANYTNSMNTTNNTTTPTKMSATQSSPAATTGTPCICNICGRKYNRRCDLNRHSRTHTRPFKCQVPNCEYVQRGFPTSQELQRHMDDRHSNKPPIFHCSYEDCTYTSKRESNCKQHMEKTHGWVYDRSRHNNNNAAARAASNRQSESVADADNEADIDADADGETESIFTKQKDEDEEDEMAFKYAMPAAASSTLSPTGEDYARNQQQLLQYQQLQQFGNPLSHATTPMPILGTEADFTLFPENRPQQQQHASMNNIAAALADGSLVYTTNTDTPAISAATAALRGVNASPMSNSFVPWESPLTQQEEISNLIHNFELQPQQNQPMPSMTPPTHTLGHSRNARARRAQIASAYPQAIGYFAPANYHAAQVPLPSSLPGSTVPSAAAAGDYAAAFSPVTPFMGTPQTFNQQQVPAYASPHTPLVGGSTLFPQAWPALLSTTAAQQQQQQQVFADQAAALRQQARLKAQLEMQAKAASIVDEKIVVAAGDRGVKRDHDTYERDNKNTVADDSKNVVDNGNEEDNEDGDEDEDDNDGNNRRPPRPSRTGPNNTADIDDDHMPCPYHLTDPEYFYRDNEERFSPCHTQHRYISTLFRHLGRAAHNLIITENSASSFGIHEAGDRPQPQAGLCRRCWTSFTDQAAFNAHVELGRPCARASRSKREKYSQILHTFCAPRPQPDAPAAPAVAPTAPAPTPMIRASQPTLQPAAPIESNVVRAAPPQVRVQVGQAQAVPIAPGFASATGGGAGTVDPRSPDIKVSPTQDRSNILADLSPNRSQGPVQGRAHPQNRPQHKHHNSVESATLVDDYYVSRSEFQGFTQVVTQRLSALEAMMQQFGTGFASAIAPSTSRRAASSSSTRPTSSMGLSAHEQGCLVREMDRQTIPEADEEQDDDGAANRARRQRRRHNLGQSQESRVSASVGGVVNDGQTLAEPLRTLSGLSSSSDSSSVRHVPPPASVTDENPRPHQQQAQQQPETIADSGYFSSGNNKARIVDTMPPVEEVPVSTSFTSLMDMSHKNIEAGIDPELSMFELGQQDFEEFLSS